VTEALGSIDPPSSAADLLARCEEKLLRANGELRELGRRREGGVVGTTLAALLTYGRDYACTWSGDSRIIACGRAGSRK
jgi:protein phosphatase